MNGSWRDQRYPPSTDPFRSLRTVGGWLIGLLAFNASLGLLAVLFDVSYLGLIDRAREGLVTPGEAATADDRHQTLAIIQLTAYVITAIVFIVWFRRGYRNLGQLGAPWLRFKPGWATGAWFVPFLNTVRTKEIANDIWRTSDPELPGVLDGPALGHRVSPLVDLWWFAVIVSAVIARVILTSDPATTLDQVQGRVQLFLVGDIWDAMLSILAIAVVAKITNRQDQRWHRLSGAGPTTSFPAMAGRAGPPPPPPPP